MKTDDEVVVDAAFLFKHPGWSYRDLLETPDELVAALKLLDAKSG